MIGNFPDEQYQLSSEYAKGAHLNANIILSLEDLKIKASRLTQMYLKDNMQN